MKHTLKITILILAMFIITQLIGLYVVNFYLSDGMKVPYGFSEANLPADKNFNFYLQFITSFIVSFIIAIALILLLMRIKSKIFIRGWFFIVVSLALGITLTILTTKLGLVYPSLFALALGVVLAYLKFFRRNIIFHNITELLIYPGIAAIFVAMFNLWAVIILLLAISVYDIWAVWRSGIMQRMAKFQIRTLGMLGGFMIPYASKKTRQKIKLLRLKYRNQIPEKEVRKHKLKIGLAILGGGDIIFPIIAAGVFMKVSHSIPAALIVTLFASLALLFLLFFGKKKKAYPAMPYLTAGILLGMIIGQFFI